MKPSKNYLAFRVLAILCLLISLHRTAYGLHAYKAERALKLNNYLQALAAAEEGLKFNTQNLELLFKKAQSAWSLYKQTGDKSALEKSREAVSVLTHAYPFWGRGWIYGALVQLEGKDTGVWLEAAQKLRKGVSLEPGNAWVLNTAAQLMLRHWKELTVEQKQTALELLKKSLVMTDSNQASSYLPSSLELLWQAEPDFNLLLRTVPKTIYSYDELLKFTLRKNIWKERAPLFTETQKLRQEVYNQQCRKAEELMMRGLKQRAFFEFQMASWLDNTRVYAEAGMLVSGFPNSWWPFKPLSILKRVVMDRREDWSQLLPQLQPAVEAYGDEPLKLAYAERLKNIEVSSEVTMPPQQTFPAELWWSREEGNVFVTSGKSGLGIPVELNPGKNRIIIAAKNTGLKMSYIRIALSDEAHTEPLGEAVVESPSFENYTFEFFTPGGKYWLQAELMNGKPQDGPEVAFGPVKIESFS